MTIKDAANLLIAIGGTAVTREAGKAIKRFRNLPATEWNVNNQEAVDLYATWLTPLISPVVTLGDWTATGVPNTTDHLRSSVLGREKRETWYHYPSPMNDQSPYPDFGRFIEFLIEQAMSGDLIKAFRKIAVADISQASDLDVYEGSRTVDELILERSCPAIPPEQKKFGPAGHIRMFIEFDRIEPRVHIEVTRLGLRPEVVFEFDFDRGSLQEGSDFNVTARIGLNSVMVLGALLSGRKIPKKIRTGGQLTTFLYDQSP
jgi:hypothetical protein